MKDFRAVSVRQTPENVAVAPKQRVVDVFSFDKNGSDTGGFQKRITAISLWMKPGDSAIRDPMRSRFNTEVPRAAFVGESDSSPGLGELRTP
jgi:hypothetical protein